MKLLFCPYCYDVFKLDMKLRRCLCGKVAGKYINDSNAVVNGQGYSLAIGNGSLENACAFGAEHRKEGITEYSKVLCWVRPHEGKANPHTFVDPNLGEEE